MRALALSLAIVALGATSARAQDTAGRARQLFELGVAAMDRGQPAEAAAHFDQSYRLYPRASTACNMALAQERLARPCDALRWYRQCAAIDREGDKREHANRQAARLAPGCGGAAPVHDPFVRTPAGPAAIAASGSVRVVEGGAPTPAAAPVPDHTLLGFGIAGLVLGLGAIGSGIGAALEAQAAAAQLPAPPADFTVGSAEAQTLERATLLRDVALGLYIGGGVVAGLGLVALIVDLAQPGVFGPRAARGDGPRLVLAPAPGGAFGGLGVRF